MRSPTRGVQPRAGGDAHLLGDDPLRRVAGRHPADRPEVGSLDAHRDPDGPRGGPRAYGGCLATRDRRDRRARPLGRVPGGLPHDARRLLHDGAAARPGGGAAAVARGLTRSGSLMEPGAAWRFLVVGYGLTVLIEVPVLLVGLSSRHGWCRRVAAGIWLTACTYPVVVLVLPYLIEPRWGYVLGAETFAPLAEWGLFRLAFPEPPPRSRADGLRDGLAIIAANLASFGIGLIL